MRIVSLVPSLTELVLDLGLEEELVGRTKFCIHPQNIIKSIPKVGGTKNANIPAIIALKPDLILANKEENTKDDIEALKHLVKVHVTDIPNYDEALNAIKDIGILLNREQESIDLIQSIKSSFSNISHLAVENKKVCYLIWNNPMMTIGSDTYIHAMLDKCGLENIFGAYNRYPTVSVDEIKERNPEFIFLSSEPFPFKTKHLEQYSKLFPDSQVLLVDGESFSWYGSRMILASKYFKSLLSEIG